VSALAGPVPKPSTEPDSSPVQNAAFDHNLAAGERRKRKTFAAAVTTSGGWHGWLITDDSAESVNSKLILEVNSSIFCGQRRMA